MNMKTIKNIISTVFALAAPLLLASCTERTDIYGGKNEPLLVVYGTITDVLETQSVQLQSVAPYFSDYYERAVQGATVTLYSSTGKTYPMYDRSFSGWYYTEEKIAASPGEKFTLEIELDPEEYSMGGFYFPYAETPHPVEMESVDIIPITTLGIKQYSILLTGQDPEGPNYYLFLFRVNGKSVNTRISQMVIVDDTYFDEQRLERLAITTFYSEESRDDLSEAMQSNHTFLAPGDEVTVSVCNISKGYYDFISQCQTVKNGSNPFFGGPGSNITTNVDGGAGYFTSYCTSELKATVPAHE